MPACRGANDADALGINFPFSGVGAHQPHRARRVLQHRGMPVAMRAEAILHHETGDAIGHEPVGVTLALVRGESAVAATGKNDHGRAARRGWVREVRRDGGNVLIVRAACAGRGVRPEGQGGLCVGERGDHDEQEAANRVGHGYDGRGGEQSFTLFLSGDNFPKRWGISLNLELRNSGKEQMESCFS